MPALTCRYDGAGLQRIEHLEDHGLRRTRGLFVCGHSVWRGAELPSERPINARVCVDCGEATVTDWHRRKCDRCRQCPGCARNSRGRREYTTHSVAACPKRVAA